MNSEKKSSLHTKCFWEGRNQRAEICIYNSNRAEYVDDPKACFDCTEDISVSNRSKNQALEIAKDHPPLPNIIQEYHDRINKNCKK